MAAIYEDLPKVLTVDLPVCELCGHVGKMPNIGKEMALFCRGPSGNPHKRQRMVQHVFVMKP